MTVRDLIKELQEMPQDLPVISDFKEVANVTYTDGTYYLDNSPEQYSCYEAVIIS